MDWDAPAIVLDARPFNEGDAIATVMTEEHGLHRGLARGGASRAQAGLWQPGNLVQVRWVARLSDQLGSFSAEMIHAGAAFVIDDPLALAMLSAVCAVAEGALPEREPHPRVFHGLVHLVARLPRGAAMLNDLIRVGNGAAGRSRLRPGPDVLRGHRRDLRPGLRLAPHRPCGDRRRRRHLDVAPAAPAGLPGGGDTAGRWPTAGADPTGGQRRQPPARPIGATAWR